MASGLLETAVRLLRTAGTAVSAVDIEPTGDDVPELRWDTVTARVELATATGTRPVTVSAKLGTGRQFRRRRPDGLAGLLRHRRGPVRGLGRHDPEPAGAAVLVQAIYADDYRGAAVTFRGQLRATDLAAGPGCT